MRASKRADVTARDLAKMLSGSGFKGTEIELLVCHTGRKIGETAKPFAKELADLTGAKVKAPLGPVNALRLPGVPRVRVLGTKEEYLPPGVGWAEFAPSMWSGVQRFFSKMFGG
jgi:hypothetical protein